MPQVKVKIGGFGGKVITGSCSTVEEAREKAAAVVTSMQNLNAKEKVRADYYERLL